MAGDAPDWPPGVGEGARERILAIALRRFAKDGYGRTRLREVASEAGVTTGPMYHYFGSKLGLYREVCLRELKRIIESYEQVAGSGTTLSRRERVQVFFERLADERYAREDIIWLGVQIEHDAVRHSPVAEFREDGAHELERVFQLAAGTRPDPDGDGWDQNPLVLLMLTLAHGQTRAVVRNGLEVMAPSIRGLERFLIGPPASERP